jgi:hypothetical protein
MSQFFVGMIPKPIKRDPLFRPIERDMQLNPALFWEQRQSAHAVRVFQADGSNHLCKTKIWTAHVTTQIPAG